MTPPTSPSTPLLHFDLRSHLNLINEVPVLDHPLVNIPFFDFNNPSQVQMANQMYRAALHKLNTCLTENDFDGVVSLFGATHRLEGLLSVCPFEIHWKNKPYLEALRQTWLNALIALKEKPACAKVFRLVSNKAAWSEFMRDDERSLLARLPDTLELFKAFTRKEPDTVEDSQSQYFEAPCPKPEHCFELLWHLNRDQALREMTEQIAKIDPSESELLNLQVNRMFVPKSSVLGLFRFKSYSWLLLNPKSFR